MADPVIYRANDAGQAPPPTNGSPISQFRNVMKGNGQKTVDQLTPDELVTQLGKIRVGFDSNSPGSAENNNNNYLNLLNSDQLIKRYSTPGINLVSSQDRAGQLAYSQFKSTFGRDPSGSEMSQILPSFMGPNGSVAGRQALANLQQTYKMNPGIDPNSPQNKATPADFTKQINDTFQSTLGRAPDANELAHFSQAMQSGQTDAYGLTGFLKQQPEYTNAADAKFRSGLNDQLASYDSTAFNRMGAPQIFSQYAQNGMPTGSSPSLQYALTDLMGRMAQNRSQYLAQLSASQYGGNKDLATQNYQNTSNQLMNSYGNNLNNAQNLGSSLNQRGYNGLDYQTQQNDFMKYISSMQQPNNNFMNYLNTGLNAVNTGANVYRAYQGPAGAAALAAG